MVERIFAEALEARGTDWDVIAALYATLHKGALPANPCGCPCGVPLRSTTPRLHVTSCEPSKVASSPCASIGGADMSAVAAAAAELLPGPAVETGFRKLLDALPDTAIDAPKAPVIVSNSAHASYVHDTCQHSELN